VFSERVVLEASGRDKRKKKGGKEGNAVADKGRELQGRGRERTIFKVGQTDFEERETDRV
jgi:hypothetical protein